MKAQGLAWPIYPLAHLIRTLRELSNVSVLQLRKWIIELLVPRVTVIHLYIPQGIMECLLCAELCLQFDLGGQE